MSRSYLHSKQEKLITIAQLQYQYFTQDVLHDGPVMDLKFDPQFCRLASVGGSSAQLCHIVTTDGREWTLKVFWTLLNLLHSAAMQRLIPPSPSTPFTAVSVHFCDNGASLLLTTLETHKVSVSHTPCHDVSYPPRFSVIVTWLSLGRWNGRNKFVQECRSVVYRLVIHWLEISVPMRISMGRVSQLPTYTMASTYIVFPLCNSWGTSSTVLRTIISSK